MGQAKFVVAGVVFAALMVVGAGVAPRLFRTPAEQLIADRFFWSQTLYHVADLQARPAVTAALSRLRAANICELKYSILTAKFGDPRFNAQLCEAVGGIAGVDLEDALRPREGQATRFAVFLGEDGTQYLIADGKHGKVGADEMEALVVGVVDRAIAALPAAIVEAQGRAAASQAADAAGEAARREAQQSFK